MINKQRFNTDDKTENHSMLISDSRLYIVDPCDSTVVMVHAISLKSDFSSKEDDTFREFNTLKK